jgi:hypothetical protein
MKKNNLTFISFREIIIITIFNFEMAEMNDLLLYLRIKPMNLLFLVLSMKSET